MKNFNYFYTGVLGLPTSQLQIYYDFNQVGANPILPQPSSQSQYQGTINSVGNFYSSPGSGLFSSSQYVSITNAGGLNGNNFSMFFVYDKPYSGNAVLYSSLSSGTYVSGFIIGINDANKLYFECYDQNGPNIYTSSNVYGSKNAIAVVKQSNIVNFYYYNFNEQTVEPELFFVSSTALYQNGQAFLGSPVNAPSYVTENSFNGYMDQFVYSNIALTADTISCLFSGFFASGIPDTINYSGIIVDLITGASIQLNAVGTGITGFQVYFSGMVLDNDGGHIPVYLYGDLTGTIIEDTFVSLSSPITYQIASVINNGYFLDTGYCDSFGMNGVTYLRNSEKSYTEIYSYLTFNVSETNLLAKYNSDGTFKLDSFYNNNLISLYANGISYFPSGYTISGNPYVSSIVLEGDYLISGQSVISNGLFTSKYSIDYDVISGTRESYNLTNTGSASFSTSLTSYRAIFLNGVKLVEGSDYSFAGSSLNLVNIPATGVVTNFPLVLNYSYYAGSFGALKGGIFARTTSEVWMNGQKQIFNLDYVENSDFDLLGSGIFENFPYFFYNNSLKQFSQTL